MKPNVWTLSQKNKKTEFVWILKFCQQFSFFGQNLNRNSRIIFQFSNLSKETRTLESRLMDLKCQQYKGKKILTDSNRKEYSIQVLLIKISTKEKSIHSEVS